MLLFVLPHIERLYVVVGAVAQMKDIVSCICMCYRCCLINMKAILPIFVVEGYS